MGTLIVDTESAATDALLELLELSTQDVLAGRLVNKQQLLERIKVFHPAVKVSVVFKDEQETEHLAFSPDTTLAKMVSKLGHYHTGVAYYAIDPEG